MLRRPLCRPLSRDQGARPARATAVLPSIRPSSGSSATGVAAVNWPTPGTLWYSAAVSDRAGLSLSRLWYAFSRQAISSSSQAMCPPKPGPRPTAPCPAGFCTRCAALPAVPAAGAGLSTGHALRHPRFRGTGGKTNQGRRRSGRGFECSGGRFWLAARRPGRRRAPGWDVPGGRVLRLRPAAWPVAARSRRWVRAMGFRRWASSRVRAAMPCGSLA